MEERKYFPRSEPPCPMSDPTNSHKLCRRSDPPLSICFACKDEQFVEKRYYYYCTTCDLEFHRGCHFYPPEIKHPFHLLHPLTLTFSDPYFNISDIPNDWDTYSSHSEDDNIDSYLYEGSISDGNHVICKSCRRHIDDKYYHCSICNFSLHIRCTMNRPPLTIENLKSHDHTLTFFPRPFPLPCDACGFSLSGSLDHVYSCLLCNYMVHRKCIYLPRVIHITRHKHRLSHTSSIVPSGEFSCGVCRKTVDINCGQYSCIKGCHYAVHSKCATQHKVWDGTELEGVAERGEQDNEPFVRIDKETIQHFSHGDHLKIYGNENQGEHENKLCQACILPIAVSDRFYGCIRGDFVLHEACASLPRKNYHPIHKHSLILVSPGTYESGHEYPTQGFFKCDGCGRYSCGFMYKCSKKDCHFLLDARCALLPDPTILESRPHEHPLFFNFTKGKCLGCKTFDCSREYLECVECNLFLGIRCATLPCVAHYKHDKHPLTLCCGEEEADDLQYWCEICEKILDKTEWFYTCNSCCVTLHVTCLLGTEIYMKPNHTIILHNEKVDIVRNNGNTRPNCEGCGCPCKDTMVFKWNERNVCTFRCVSFNITIKD